MAPLPKGGWLRSRLGDIVGAIHESPAASKAPFERSWRP